MGAVAKRAGVPVRRLDDIKRDLERDDLEPIVFVDHAVWLVALVERLRDAGNALADEAGDAIGYAPEWARDKWGHGWSDAIAEWTRAALAAADGTDGARDDGQGGT